MKCIWCDCEEATQTTKDCQWIQADGADVVFVTDIPAINCPRCRDIYLAEEVNEEIEVALHTIDLEPLGSKFSYEALMKAPKPTIFELFQRNASFGCNRP